jgi:hypothetical protein
MADLEILPCTVPAGATVSAPVGIGFKVIVGFVMPPVWTETSVRPSQDP